MKKILFTLFILHTIFCFSQTKDAKGRKQGYWKKTDDKNKLIYEGAFKDDKPVGKFKHYYPNDSVRAIMNFKDDGKTAYVKLFHMNGKRMGEGKYIDMEIKDSTWSYYDELGILLSRENYKSGKKEGAAYVYLPDGSISEQREYKNNVLNGPFKDFFEKNLLKAQGTYAKGQMDGRVSYYYPNGVEVAAGYYRNGQKNGAWIYKTQSGKIREKELYKNGVLASQKETEEFFSKNKVEEKQPAPNQTSPVKKTNAPKKQ